MNIDPAAINTFLLTLFGIGGSVLIFRYINPILKTQDAQRIRQAERITELEKKMAALESERELLKEMVTQRAQVDDLRQFVKIVSEDGSQTGRSLTRAVETLTRDTAEQHQKQTMVLNEMVSVLRGIEYRMGSAPARGPAGERGEKGDHGQDAGT